MNIDMSDMNILVYSFIHSFIFSNLLILVKGIVDPEPIPGNLSVRNEYTLDGMPVCHSSACTGTFPWSFTPLV